VTEDRERMAELATELEDLQNELAAQTVRLELAQALPRLGWGTRTVKKTKPPASRPRKRRRK
jgi:hypothetical protein